MNAVFPDSMRWASPQQQAAYLDAQNEALGKQYDEQQAAEKAQQQQATTPLAPHQQLIQKVTNAPTHVTTSYLDDIVNFADSVAHDGSWGEAATRVGRDAAAGVADAAANTGDAIVGAVQDEAKSLMSPREAALEAEDPAMANRMKFLGENAPPSIWEHAKNAILDFRDAVTVKDPNLVDNLTQMTAQLAIPFAGYSKMLEGLQLATLGFDSAEGISATQGFGSYLAKTALNDAGKFAQKVVLPGAATDATALAPHAPRFADMIALGKQTDNKFVTALNTLDPTGGGVNAYINYLTDRSDESDAEGRFKNVLDGLAVNSIATPLFTAVGSVLKQGGAGLRYLVDNGVASTNDLRRPFAQPKPGWADVAPAKKSLAQDASGERVSDKNEMPQWNHANLESLLDTANSPLEKDAALSKAREFVQAQSAAKSRGSVKQFVAALAQHIDGSTEEGAFYKEILGKLAKHESLDGDIVAPGTGTHPEGVARGIAGQHSLENNTITVYPRGLKNNADFAWTVSHEAVHMATRRALRDSPITRGAIQDVVDQAARQSSGLAKRDAYGLANPDEFVAEAEANPRFQEFLKTTPAVSDGRPLWEHYKDAIAGIFGLSGAVTGSALFDKLLSGRNKRGT